MARDVRQEAHRRLGHRVAGRYHLRKVLGIGGMGVVYAAWHEFTERLVALKLLHANIAVTHVHAQRFLQEATASGAIRHPGIADVLDAGREADGTLYVAFELLDGEDLGAAIQARRVPPSRMLEVAVEVLAALEAAHVGGFIHRDIKPANIFLLRESRAGVRVKLLDFGIARRIRRGASDALTQAGSVVGTPYYMSPEQMCGEAVDGRADLWALAIVVYYGLTGELPFQGRSYVSLLTEMLRKGPPGLPRHADVPAGVEPLIKRALAPRIEDRFQSAEEMKRAMETVLPPAASAQTQPFEPHRTTPTARRTPARVTPTAGPATPSAVSDTEETPQWRQALEDIEGEISAMEARQPTSRPRAVHGPNRKRNWFGRKR